MNWKVDVAKRKLNFELRIEAVRLMTDGAAMVDRLRKVVPFSSSCANVTIYGCCGFRIQSIALRRSLQGTAASKDAVTIRAFLRLAAAKGLVLGLFLFSAWPAAATQEYVLPTLFDVTGVAANDVLNIRAAPNASAAIIGTLSPDARDIEVVGYDETGRWARINTGESSGWAALRFLAYQVDVWNPGTLPPTLHCLGNEPFWSFRPRGERVVFSTPEAQESAMSIEQVVTTGMFRDPRRSVSAQGETSRITAVMVPVACSDGMSDRAYGLDVTVILEGRGEPQMLTGCCSVAPR